MGKFTIQCQCIEEAILLHGGEATSSIDAYKNLSSTEKEAILKFLQSL